jgi:hypothetical protein
MFHQLLALAQGEAASNSYTLLELKLQNDQIIKAFV